MATRTTQNTTTATLSATQRNALKLIPFGFGGSAQRIGISLMSNWSHVERLPNLNPDNTHHNIEDYDHNTPDR